MHSHSRSKWARVTSSAPLAAPLAATLAAIAGLSGCARAVLPSEKAFLADPIMQFDSDALETAGDNHVLSNREGAIGGKGSAGGGCGCN